MERKIGEIFEYNGEWYQCLEEKTCTCFGCDLRDYNCDDISLKDVKGSCQSERRKDNKSVIFKKLEKLGEPFERNDYMYQEYKAHTFPLLMNGDAKIPTSNGFAVIIKQNKEDMEENKTTLPKEDNALTRTVYAYVNGKISDKELIRSIKKMSDEYPYIKNNLKPFSLELAKQGKPVCTRDGRKARIICFDAKCTFPIIALVTNTGGNESLIRYYSNGSFTNLNKAGCDLMMLPEKKEGWVNVYHGLKKSEYVCGDIVSNTKEEAIQYAQNNDTYITTVKISWEE